jgi:hypothetical protein
MSQPVVAEKADVEHAPAGEPLVRVKLVPVQVFGGMQTCEGCGADVPWGYGLMDAVQAWSDCNRAIGHIYRKDEQTSEPWRQPGDTITIYVPRPEMVKFERTYGEINDE